MLRVGMRRRALRTGAVTQRRCLGGHLVEGMPFVEHASHPAGPCHRPRRPAVVRPTPTDPVERGLREHPSLAPAPQRVPRDPACRGRDVLCGSEGGVESRGRHLGPGIVAAGLKITLQTNTGATVVHQRCYKPGMPSRLPFRVRLSSPPADLLAGHTARFELNDGRRVDVCVPHAVACESRGCRSAGFRIEVFRSDGRLTAAISASELVDLFGAHAAARAIHLFLAGDLGGARRLATRAGGAWNGLRVLLDEVAAVRRTK